MEEEKPEATKKFTDLVQVCAIAIGLLTSAILVAGYTYYIGYISAFGLDASLMDRGLADVIAESWYVGLLALVYVLPFWWYPFAFMAAVVMLMLAAYCIRRQREKGKDVINESPVQQNQDGKRLGDWISWLEMIVYMAGWALTPGAIMLLTWLFFVTPFQKGNATAKVDIEKYQKNKCTTEATTASPERCVALIDIAAPSKPVAYGIVVSGSRDRIAIFSEKGLQVWPLTSSYRIDKAYIGKPAESPNLND